MIRFEESDRTSHFALSGVEPSLKRLLTFSRGLFNNKILNTNVFV